MDLTKEAVLAAVRHAPAAGWKIAELATELSLDGKGRHRLRRLLQELMEAGEVERGPGARYLIPGAAKPAAPPPTPAPAPAETGANGVVGRIRVHPAGYGFVEREDGEADVFVPARFRGTAMDGDQVRLATWLGYKGVEGRVEAVLQRGRARLTGTVRQAGRTVYLEPDDPRIASTYGHVALENGAGGAREGQSVVAEIVRYPTDTAQAGGVLHARVQKILGEPDDPRTEVEKVIAMGEIPDQFPEDTLALAKRTPQDLGAQDFADRVDLRDRPFLTIDPVTARDFDDAVCLEERPGGWRLWVAVADVSHYVRPGNALDREARIRGCSVYLPDRAIPMLPRELSAGICSLNPEVDRCAMVARIDLDPGGGVVATGFAAAVIRSHARLDYEGVAAALAGDFRGPRARYEQWKGALAKMQALSKTLRERRRQRGSLDFDLPEAKVVVDDDDPRLVRDVVRSKADPEVKGAYQLVEELMLAANEAVGEFLHERGHDTVWRVHDHPSDERLAQFAALAQAYGVSFDPEEGARPLALQQVLREIGGKPYERALNFLLLRSMKQATYDVVNIGHFGLASSSYLHFTSPIRRYPDLIVHRLLKFHLRREGLPSGGASHPAPPPREMLQVMAHESAQHERRAVAAEREVTDMYRAFLMRDRIGDELDGIVSGVTHFGLFIECKEPFVEGLVKSDALGEESFQFEEEAMRLRGRRSGRMFSLGDPVRVRVVNVSVARRQIDLILIEGGTIGEVHEVVRRKEKKRAADPKGREQRDERRRHGGGGGRRSERRDGDSDYGGGRRRGRPAGSHRRRGR